MDTNSSTNINGTDTRDNRSSPLNPMMAVMLKPSPNSTINGMPKPSASPSSLTSTMATVAVPQAYQPSSAKPSRKSERRLPASPKQKRPINTVFSPLREAMKANTAAYKASKLLPRVATHSMSTKLNAMPSLPPANIVPVKKVKLNKTIAIGNRPLRADCGASLRGNSLGELIARGLRVCSWELKEQYAGRFFTAPPPGKIGLVAQKSICTVHIKAAI